VVRLEKNKRNRKREKNPTQQKSKNKTSIFKLEKCKKIINRNKFQK
jgi:hypothetical protein